MNVRRAERAQVGRIGKRRQVVIPKRVCEALGLREGDFVEVRTARGGALIKPKKLVDSEDLLTPEEEVSVRRGEAQLRRGEYMTLAQIRRELGRPTVKRSRKTA